VSRYSILSKKSDWQKVKNDRVTGRNYLSHREWCSSTVPSLEHHKRWFSLSSLDHQPC
jgi:hypothetical protein